MTKILAFAPEHDKLGRHDATGAFRPEMAAFAREWDRRGHQVRPVTLDNDTHRGVRDLFVDVRAELGRENELRAVALFMHGLKHGIPQIGWNLANAEDVAMQLFGALAVDGVVALYACDAARDNDSDRDDDLELGTGGEGGFADALADSLRLLGWRGWIDAHATPAHTTSNPYVRRFYGEATGGRWIVKPRSSLWPAWARSLRSRATSTLRLRFPLMREAAIEDELAAAPT